MCLNVQRKKKRIKSIQLFQSIDINLCKNLQISFQSGILFGVADNELNAHKNNIDPLKNDLLSHLWGALKSNC